MTSACRAITRSCSRVTDTWTTSVRCRVQRELSGKLSREDRDHRAQLQQHIKTIIGISAKVNVMEFEGIPRTLTRSKARRVIDQRPKQL